MNNEQFRKLIQANSTKADGAKNAGSPTTSSSGGGAALGSRQRASIPMTPRSVGGSQASFARQLAERQQAVHSQKKFKTSAPRGVKLASGYVDRARDREESTADDREERLKNLEELYKKEEIDRETFEKLRFEIAGGDLQSTHLVKGLDFKLLERIRKGEDVYTEKDGNTTEEPEEAEPDANVDDEFDQMEERDIQAIERDKPEKKKGQLSTVALASSKKRTRDQILAELKAARLAAKAQQESALSDRFRKIGAKQMPGSRIERDSKGREVLIIVDEDGHEKRKVRKLQHDNNKEAPQSDLLMPDKNAKPLGMEVPEQYRNKAEPEEDSDVDIFEGVGDDYDPLAGMDDASSDSEDEANEKPEAGGEATAVPESSDVAASSSTPDRSMGPPPKPASAPAARNYFQGSKTGLISAEASKAPSMSDPAVLAAIKRAAALKAADRKDEDGDDDDDDGAKAESKALEERRKRLLQANDRDDYDLDMGFGTSRFEDEEDLGDEKVKLSAWGDEDDGSSRGGKSQRKKRTRKRKGDANNADDILRVIEQRKKSS